VDIGGAQSLFGVIPDLAVFGKAVGGGFPFSVIAGKEEIINEVIAGNVVHAGTFNGNPIALSAALATIETLASNGSAALKAAQAYGEKIMSSFRALATEFEIPIKIEGHGTVFRPIIGSEGPLRNYRDVARASKEAMQALVVELFNRGLYCVPDGRWYVSVVHGEQEQQQTKEILQQSLRALAIAHFGGARA